MAEGAMFPWKVQRLKLAPSLSYDSIHRPLKAPKGKGWIFDPVDKQWSLAEIEGSAKIVEVSVVSTTVEDTNGNIKVPHHISPSDTLRRICLRYEITPLELRRANGDFTGKDLSLAPNPLMIPLKDVVASEAVAEEAEPLSQSEVADLLLNECRGMIRSEARAYLMLSDWDLAEALENAREDGF